VTQGLRRSLAPATFIHGRGNFQRDTKEAGESKETDGSPTCCFERQNRNAALTSRDESGKQRRRQLSSTDAAADQSIP